MRVSSRSERDFVVEHELRVVSRSHDSRAMIDREEPKLSLVRQLRAMLGISRSSLYYPPRPMAGAEDMELMALIDANST